MKKVLLLVVLFAFATMMVAQDAHLAQHDILANGVQQGCRSCHIPHGGSIAAAATKYSTRVTVFGTGIDDESTGTFKLWDKNLSTNSYTTYSSDNITAGTLAAPSNVTSVSWHSYLCFSCHDGAIAALNMPSGFSFDTAAYLMNNGRAGTAWGGSDTDLSNDHPVDVSWPTTGNMPGTGTAWSAEYEKVTAVTSNSGYTGGWAAPAELQSLPVYNGLSGTGATLTSAIECSTCHNVHLQATPAINVNGNFLRLTAQSDNVGLCRQCHLSKR